jgi:hypothetical protein
VGVKREQDQVDFLPVDVNRAGYSMKVYLLKIGSEEGLTTRQAAELFNVSESTILKHIDRHNITTVRIFQRNLQLLKNSGIVRNRAISALFIPRDGLRELMRVIGTDEAKAAYRLLFDDAEELMVIKPLYLEQKKIIAEKDQVIAEKDQAINLLEHDLAKSISKITTLEKLTEDLKAKNGVLERHIVGKSGKSRKFEVIVRTEHRVNMFGERDDVLHIEKKPLEEMTQRERKGWSAQHTTKVGRGMIRKAAQFYENSEDSAIRNASRGACDSVDHFHDTLWPKDAKVEYLQMEGGDIQ